ncbi:MAG: GtrA family protein, partial [Demequina sp.]|nr:GtrA family protein [Demequina sp.]
WGVLSGAAVLVVLVVVGVGVLVLIGVFFTPLSGGRCGPLYSVGGKDDRVVTAKVIATVVSILFAWVAHRGWTFKGQRRHRPATELTLFGAVNAVAIVVEAGLVALTHHGFGWTSLLADNASSLVGIGLGTVVRYFGFTVFVFPGGGREDPSA